MHVGIVTMNESAVFLKRHVMRNCCLTQVCYYMHLSFSAPKVIFLQAPEFSG